MKESCSFILLLYLFGGYIDKVHYLVKARAHSNMWLLSVMKRWHFGTALSVNNV